MSVKTTTMGSMFKLRYDLTLKPGADEKAFLDALRVLNRLDRCNLVMSAVYNLPQLGNRGAYLIQQMQDKLVEHRQYIAEYGVDLPEVSNWKWS